MTVTESVIDLSKYKQHIESALAYADATHAYEDVQAMIAAGDAQVWPGPASVIVTEICRYPRKAILNFFLAAGNIRELEAMVPLICQWGKEKGAEVATFTGRKGWAKHPSAVRLGFTPSLTFYSKPL